VDYRTNFPGRIARSTPAQQFLGSLGEHQSNFPPLILGISEEAGRVAVRLVIVLL
jgi:hypothetical protein